MPGGLAGYTDDNDMSDSAPLLNHAQPAFGIPHSASATRFQLRDDGMGDMGMRNQAIGQQGYPDSSIGFGTQGSGGTGHQMGMGPSADEEENNMHYGPVPTRVVRRNRTQKRVK